MTAATTAKWAERVREWRASGKTTDEFASAYEFEASTLRYWASRLKTEAIEKPSPMLARVIRRGPRAAGTEPAKSELEIALGAARIVVRRGFDAELLREVVAALGSVR